MKTRRDLVSIVGEAATGREAIRMVEQLRPDVVLMDISMPDGDGLEAAAIIREHCPQTAVVMLTASEADEDLYRAVQLGAAGYLLKDLDAQDLFDMLEGIEHGEALLTRSMGARLLKVIAQKPKDNHADLTSLLTEREIEVLRLVAQGESNSQIADSLTISINTVKVHLRNILDKLSVENRTQAAAYAVRYGLVSAAPRL